MGLILLILFFFLLFGIFFRTGRMPKQRVLQMLRFLFRRRCSSAMCAEIRRHTEFAEVRKKPQYGPLILQVKPGLRPRAAASGCRNGCVDLPVLAALPQITPAVRNTLP